MSDVVAALEEIARRRLGTQLRRGKYKLDALLGVGAMGSVYSATHRNGMRVAIKILHAELARSDSLRARFLREGYIANRVQHPGVVRVLDDDMDDDGSTFLVMELLEGRTLSVDWEAAPGRRLPPPRVVAIADGALDVLEAVHAQQIIHRDIKPDNVFLTKEGGLKLLDLGIARLLDARVTASGQMMGTPEFVSPEQAGGRVREIDARSDLYSVGAMMFSLMTGHVVHEARTPMEGMVFAATVQARSLMSIWPNAPAALANVVDVALAYDKAKRWSSAAEMRTALANAMRLYPAATSAPASGPFAAAPQSGVASGVGSTVVMGSAERDGRKP